MIIAAETPPAAQRKTALICKHVDRIQRRHRHDAANRGAAVGRRRRPLQDLDLSYEVEIRKRTPCIGKAADGKGARPWHAIGFDADPVTANAANRDRLVAESRGVTAHRDTRFETNQIAQILCLQLLDASGIDQRHAGLCRGQRPGDSADHHDGFQLFLGSRLGSSDSCLQRNGCREQTRSQRCAVTTLIPVSHRADGTDREGISPPGDD